MQFAGREAMKRWLFALATVAALLVGTQSAKADWIPQVNPDGSITIWINPIDDPMPPPPPKDGGVYFIVKSYVGWVAIRVG
jgi:hypothetical protein